MNILILSNNAPNYQFFFGNLAKRLCADGNSVVFAVDSTFSRDINELDKLGFEIHEFERFFSAHAADHALLERYSGFNLNDALLSDFERAETYRIQGKRDTRYFTQLKSALLAFFEQLFARHNIHTVLYEGVSNTFAYFALIVAQRNGVQYCGIGSSRLPGRFSITSDPLHDDEPKLAFERIQNGILQIPDDVKQWCAEYLDSIDTIVPDYMKFNGLNSTSLIKRYMRWERLRTISKLARYALKDSNYAFQIGNPLVHYFSLFSRNVGRAAKSVWLRGYYDAPEYADKFLLYPLHFHPEASTSILAGTFLNEYEVIKNIAFNLPQGVNLYVKDHTGAFGFPAVEFYRRLKALPNVSVIAPDAPTKRLIKSSIAVITITSTVGYEALLMGKRVFLFGTVFYEFHKGVVRVGDPSRLFELFNTYIGTELELDARYNMQFVAAYLFSTRVGTLNLMLKGDDADRMVGSVYSSIVEHLGTPQTKSQREMQETRWLLAN
jgi:hypothetical protein